jgi:hypothetical protein
MTAAKDTVPVSRVKELLSYDADTGIVSRKIGVGNRWPAGPLNTMPNSAGYLRVRIDGARCFVHRLVWVIATGAYPVGDIDHINCNKADNRLSNLRQARRSENCCNKPARKDNKAGVKGIHWDKKQKAWRAEIEFEGRRFHLGSFRSAEDAAEAYRYAALERHGRFARF